MFQLAFITCTLLLLWIESQFTTTVHKVEGNHQLFTHGWIAWTFLAAFVVLFLTFAWIARRHMKDSGLMWIALAGIPLMSVAVAPQIAYESVEISETHLIHRREPPHTEFNCNIPFSEIASVTKIKRETGSFGTYYAVGYEVLTVNGQHYVLPSCTIVTAACRAIDAEFEERNLTVETTVVRRPPPQ